ncbi:ribosome maturation factor RimM [soil metagenome]|jgi:16S rRNA processing protein RimM
MPVNDQTTPTPEGYVLLGRFGKTFQLEGGLRFRPLGDAEEAALERLESVFVAGLGERRVKRLRLVSGRPVLYLAGVTSVETAKGLVNSEVFAPKGALPEPEEGEFYLDDLIGLPVTVDGKPFGAVAEVFEAGAQDVLVLEHDEREFLVPLQAPYVEVEDDRVVITDPPEGLLEP